MCVYLYLQYRLVYSILCACVYIYIYIYICRMCVCIYIYISYVYVYIYMYINTSASVPGLRALVDLEGLQRRGPDRGFLRLLQGLKLCVICVYIYIYVYVFS